MSPRGLAVSNTSRYLSCSETRVNADIRGWKMHLSEPFWCQESVGGICYTNKWKAASLQPLTFPNQFSSVQNWPKPFYCSGRGWERERIDEILKIWWEELGLTVTKFFSTNFTSTSKFIHPKNRRIAPVSVFEWPHRTERTQVDQTTQTRKNKSRKSFHSPLRANTHNNNNNKPLTFPNHC
jgi:hypothetical protein